MKRSSLLFAILSLTFLNSCSTTHNSGHNSAENTAQSSTQNEAASQTSGQHSPQTETSASVNRSTLAGSKNGKTAVMKPEVLDKLSKSEAIKDSSYTVTPDIDLSEWKQIGDDDGVKTYQKKQEQDGLVAFRGETTIPTSIVRVAAVFDDPAIRKDWIDSLVDAKVVSQADRLHRVEYNHTAVPWPFQDRDFVYAVSIEIKRNPNIMILRMKNGDDSAVPHVDGVVRGSLVYCYYYLKEIEPLKTTKVIVELVIDPMGNIPKWLVNLSSKKWPQNTLSGLRKVAQRENLIIPADLDNYYKTGGER